MVILVIGATVGLGRFISDCFTATGHHIVARRRMKRLETQCAERGAVPVLPLTLDARDRRARDGSLAAFLQPRMNAPDRADERLGGHSRGFPQRWEPDPDLLWRRSRSAVYP